MVTNPLPEYDHSPARTSGHWLLARVGKQVLRPGGRELTDRLLTGLPLAGHDVIEFAREILAHRPASYTGVDSDPTACRRVADLAPDHSSFNVVEASTDATGLPGNSADVVIGEAMLTMQTDPRKLDIMREAARLLRPGGHYAIHEMSLTPDDVSAVVKIDIRRSLARASKVNARPITEAEWTNLADEAGFDVATVHHTDLGLLKPRRILADEGLTGTARIAANVLRQPDIRRRVLDMRASFRRHDGHLGALGLILTRR